MDIDIEYLTIRQAKELASLFSKLLGEKKESNLMNDVIGKYVIVRSRNEGINAGYVADADDTGIVLNHARRIWYHKPKDKSTSWYEGVANTGLDDSSKISAQVEKKIIIEDYSITLCTDASRKSIVEMEANGQN